MKIIRRQHGRARPDSQQLTIASTPPVVDGYANHRAEHAAHRRVRHPTRSVLVNARPAVVGPERDAAVRERRRAQTLVNTGREWKYR
jgi:hypothetical protein